MGSVLTIIGNGFDLGHDLPTSFSDFIKSDNGGFKDKYHILQSGENNWNEVEKRYGELLCDIMRSRSWVDTTEIVENIMTEYGFNQFGEIDYYNYESDAFNEEYEKIEKLIKLLTEFEIDFLSYLKEFCNDEKILKLGFRQKIKQILNNSTDIITFNYTRTVETLYNIKKVIHIHGTVDDNIAIGTGALNEAKKSMLDIEYPTIDKFEKNKYGLQELMQYYEEDMEGNLVESHFIKSFFDKVVNSSKNQEYKLFRLLDVKSKDALAPRVRIIEELKSKRYDKVYIIGHSLEEADFSVLDSIDKKAEIVCFYHSENDARNKEMQRKRLGWNCLLRSDKGLFEMTHK